jgi:hypothetical protein
MEVEVSLEIDDGRWWEGGRGETRKSTQREDFVGEDATREE